MPLDTLPVTLGPGVGISVKPDFGMGQCPDQFLWPSPSRGTMFPYIKRSRPLQLIFFIHLCYYETKLKLIFQNKAPIILKMARHKNERYYSDTTNRDMKEGKN